MRILLAIFFILHGLVHLLWFVVPWRLTEVDGLPYATTILAGKVDVGDSGIRIAGLLWLLGAIGFVIAGLGLLFAASWWWTVALVVTVYSIFLNFLGLPVSKYGLLIDIATLAVLLLGNKTGLAFLPFPD